MTFVPKEWHNLPDRSTPVSASSLMDLEQRLATFAEALPASGVPVFNVKTYGARGDGLTDDASAINAAITAAAVSGGTVVLPAGTYIIGSPLLMKELVTLQGSGINATTLKAKGATAVNVIRTANYEAEGGTPRWAIERLTIDGNKSGGATGRGIDVDGYIFALRELRIANTSGAGIKSQKTHVETTGQQEMAFFSNIRLESCEGGLLEITGPVDSIMHNVVGWRNGSGFGFKAATSCKWLHCHPCGNAEYNWEVTGANNTFVDCYAEGGKKAYIRVTGLNNRFFGGRYFYGGGEDGRLAFLIEAEGFVEAWDGNWQNCSLVKFSYAAYQSKFHGSAYSEASREPYLELATADETVRFEVDLQGSYTKPPVKELASTNSFAVGRGRNLVKVTGTEEIKKITATYPGHVVTLIFASTAKMVDGENLKLKEGFTATADDTMQLVCDGTNWYELSRSVN
ncbi:MAG: hypothetical protein JSS68_15010 [Actinobacteria bacterium]|nr:hypothetical protein [Actinomycetota bacterium]